MSKNKNQSYLPASNRMGEPEQTRSMVDSVMLPNRPYKTIIVDSYNDVEVKCNLLAADGYKVISVEPIPSSSSKFIITGAKNG